MTQPITAGAALEASAARLSAAGIENPRRESVLLLMFVLSCRREDLIREPERVLTHREWLIWTKSVELRSLRRPLAYISGESWFYGRPLKINRAVLIPRPETEMLVDFAREKTSEISEPLIADIGTGSGCIAVSVALELDKSRVVAVDISDLALLVAKKNVARYSLEERVRLTNGDLLDTVRDLQFDIILSNPPYIAANDIEQLMPEVGLYEPKLALFEGAGDDGTNLHRRLLTNARNSLKPGGWIALEVGHGQAASVSCFARECGYKSVEERLDFAGIARVVAANWID